MNDIRIVEIGIDRLEEYDKIPFYYDANQKYELKKIDNGLGGILLELVDSEPYHRELSYGTIEIILYKLCPPQGTDGTRHFAIHEFRTCTADELGTEPR